VNPRKRLAIRPHLSRRFLGATAAAVALLAVLPAPGALGSGEERTTIGEDLTIRTDSRWAGGAEGGYLPIRVLLSNHGEPRNLTFEFEPDGVGNGVRVRRVIGVEQNASVHFTLSVPLVDSRNGRLNVYDGARPLADHNKRSISVPSGLSSPSPPAMLVISPAIVDCGRFVDAAHQLMASTARAVSRGGPGAADASLLAEVVPPSLLAESWIDYSGLDFVAISRYELEQIERPARTAILKWVQCGGNLLIFEVGSDAQALSRLDRLIEAPEQPAGAGAATVAGTGAWQSAVPSERPTGAVSEAPTEETIAGIRIPVTGAAGFGREKSSKPAAGTTKPLERPWRSSKDTFRRRELMLGTVLAFAENPFPGSTNDWLWLCNSCGQQRWSWTARHGTSPHIGTRDFFKFMNPGIRSVPTVAFLVLITLFSVVIGPVNYVYLSRKKMLWLVLFTVPALALTTSVLLVGYSVAAHGFAVKSRIRSLTVLDQRQRTTVTMARLALFAGVSPSSGLRFSPDTAVFPVIPPTNDPTGGLVDWTQTQNLLSGWLPARTRTQFYTVRNAEQRSRVELKALADKTAEFSNGLPWELEMILASDDAGRLYVGRSVPAGATVTLSEPAPQDLGEFVELLRRDAPALPAGFVEPTPIGRRSRAWMVSGMRSPSTDFSSNFMERPIAQWNAQLPLKRGLAPRSYLAVLRQNPGVETGVPSTNDEMSLHLLNGYF
jgi:hypothetical protein